MPSDVAKRRRGLTLRRLVALSAAAIGIGALLRAYLPAVTARGKSSIPPSGQAVMSGYETTDIDVRGTTFILAGIAATTALVIGIVSIMVWRFDVARHAAWSHLTAATDGAARAAGAASANATLSPTWRSMRHPRRPVTAQLWLDQRRP